jgi:hypothetical protein
VPKSNFKKNQDVTKLDFDAVMEHVKNIASQEEYFDENNVKDLSKALTHYYLQSSFPDLDSYSALECIVDGSNDQGIDAIYIEEKGEKSIIHIIQTKLVMNRDKALVTTFSGNELVKFVKKFDDFVINNRFHEHANEQLKVKLDEVFSLGNKTFNVVLLSTGQAPSEAETKQFFATIDKYNRRTKNVDVDFVGLGDLADFLPTVNDPKIDIKLRFEGNIVETKSGRVQNIVIGRVQGRKIAELVRDEGDNLFAKNVRGFLKTKNSVNKEIMTTATDPDSAPYFFVLNNGITIVCDDTDYMSGIPSPEVQASGAQIVNGGQTSKTLYEALKADQLQASVEVLVRIIETKQKGVLDKVTKATNSQTSVSNRDLRSNDAIQKLIESVFKDRYNYYYEARRNKYQGKQPVRYRVDIEVATQAYYAYEFMRPDFAKSSKSSLFASEEYDRIFNTELDIDQFFFTYRLRRALEAQRSKFTGEYSFLRDAEITSLALMKRYSKIKSTKALIEAEKNGQLAKDYESILRATQQVVDEEIKNVGDKFEKRRFFISPLTSGRIQEVLLTGK